jgi:DNA-binding CsgD family transcriptional regulator/tetratricopeptide (TPR) repeat protein
MATRVTSPILVGRSRELARLQEIRRRAAEGEARVVLIGGDAGIGKSRLVEELAERAAGDGWTVALGSCVEVGSAGLAYGPLVEVLRHLREELGNDVFADLGAARLGPLLHEDASGDPVGQGRLLEQVLEFLTRLGERQASLIVFEDLHWSDAATRDLVAFLTRNLRAVPVMLVATYRTDDLHRKHPLRPLVASLEKGPADVVVLGGLSRSEVAELAQAILAGTGRTERAATIFTRTDGNPFFVEELLTVPAGDPSLPVSLRDTVLTRLERLDVAALAALRPAALLGRQVLEPLLGAITGQSPEVIETALREAVAHQILSVDVTSGCRFRHDLVREAILEDMLPGERSRLHRAAATAIESDPGLVGSERERWAYLANHWYAAHDTTRAFAASVRAGDLVAPVSPSEAADHYGLALELWDQVDGAEDSADCSREALLLRAAQVAYLAAHPQRAVGLVEAAVRTLSDSGSEAAPEERALALVALGRYRWTAGDRPGSIRAFEEADASLADRPLSAAKAQTAATRAGHLMLESLYRKALDHADRAIEMARTLGARRVEGDALNTKGVARATLGHLEEGLALVRAAAGIATEIGHHDDLIRAHTNLTYLQSFSDHPEDGLVDAAAGLDAVRRHGTMLMQGLGISEDLGECLVRLGRWDEVEALLADFPYHDLSYTTSCNMAAPLFAVALRRGQLRQAATILGPAWARAEPFDDTLLGANTRILAAQLATAEGRFNDARHRVGEALEMCGRTDDTWYAARACWAGIAVELAEIETITRGRDEALPRAQAAGDALLQRARSLVAVTETDGGRLVAKEAGFLAMVEAGFTDLADTPDPEAWTRAASRWEECKDSYWVARCRLGEADALLRGRGDRRRAATALASVLATADALGAAPLSAAARSLVQRGRLELAEQGADDTGTHHLDRSDPLAHAGLTPREVEVLQLVVRGQTNRQIAEDLYISDKTASVHVTNVLRKLEVDSRFAAADLARRVGWAAPNPSA